MSLDKEYKIDPSAENNWAIYTSSANGHLALWVYHSGLPFRLTKGLGGSHLEVVEYLMSLDKKYNIDPSADDNSAICDAIENGHLNIVKLLSIHYFDKLPIDENKRYNRDISNYIREFNKNPIEMNKK